MRWNGEIPSHQCRFAAGLLGDAVASTLDGAALMIAAGAGSLAAGVPVTVMPAPLLAAGGLAMYLDSVALRDYFLFVAGAFGTGGRSQPVVPLQLASWVITTFSLLFGSCFH